MKKEEPKVRNIDKYKFVKSKVDGIDLKTITNEIRRRMTTNEILVYLASDINEDQSSTENVL